ncbi:MAG: hypothetical protein IJQ21_07760 [Lachnospiraceae bacterium]|nr:hypothetical protein [Lachnospiraceae bacterium]
MTAEAIFLCNRSPPPLPAQPDSLGGVVNGIAYQTIYNALKETGGNISEAARLLKISRQNLQYRIKRYKINMSDFL